MKGFPTIKFFGNDKKKPEDYQGPRDADGIRKWALQATTKAVNERANKKKKDSGDNGSSSGGSSGGGSGNDGSSDKDVHVLTEDNFESKVINSKDIWMVEFYAPWCGHCKALEPEWNKAASTMKQKVKFGKVDATVHGNLAQRYGVQGYPSIFYWEYGVPKSESSKLTYNMKREAPEIIGFANNLLTKADIPPELHELTKQSIYDKECEGTVICVFAFVPNIFDSNAAERNGYLDTLMKVAKKQRS